jgi:hypothetical protein
MPDLRFILGAVLATALLAVTALGIAATLRLAQHARHGPLQNSGSLAYSDASDWNQFIDPTAARRFDELMRPVEGVSMPVSETAIADVPAPAAPSAFPEPTALNVTNAATTTSLAASAPREPSTIPEIQAAIAMSSEPAADPLPSIAPGTDTSQSAVAATPQGETSATAPAASSVERSTAVANVAVPEQPGTAGPLAAPASPSVVATLPIVALAEETGRAVPADVQAPPIVLISPTPSEPVPVVPTPVASLPTTLRAVQVTTAPFPPLPRAAPHRRFGEAAPQVYNVATRYSIVRRVRTLRTAQIQRVQPAPSPFGPMNVTATTAQPSDLFGPTTATKASRKRTEIKASTAYSDDPLSRDTSPNTFGR